jgi:ABC-type multidrug transport system fused ATPase/permease subunit
MTSSHNLLNLMGRLWSHLSKRRQRQFGLLLGLMICSAFSEVVTLGAVIPFLAVLTSPESVFAYPKISKIAEIWGIQSGQELLLPLTLAFAFAALVAGVLRMLVLWAGMRLGLASGSDLSIELYRRTLYQPYHVHLARNSSEVITGITQKINTIAFGVLQPALVLVSSMVLLVSVLIMLVAIDPFAALSVAGGFGLSYFMIALVTRRRLQRNSECVAREETQVVKALQEGLGGIRDVILDGAQSLYCEIYRQSDRPLRRAQANSQFISASPRYAMEAIGIMLIVAVAYALVQAPGGVSLALPVLGALALGAQRLLPALQQIYGSWVTIVSSQASLAETLALLDQPLPVDARQPTPEPLVFHHHIQLDDVHFRYSENGLWVLRGLTFTVPKGSRVGFVGTTGSGKSTALDIFMGLLSPTAGTLRVDDRTITGLQLRAWQRTIAHVPQSIYLADTTVAENIAFGIPIADIDMNRVRDAARKAQIAEFIESRPEGYAALIGERGVRLSGGQRQRIGIARALYKKASVLVFDEATSALDNATEQSVMDAVGGLARYLTVLLIAHRLSTVRNCDIIVELKDGLIVAFGSYEELMDTSDSFRKLAMAEFPA